MTCVSNVIRKEQTMRKGKVSLVIIVTLLIGIVIGFAIALSIGVVFHHLEPDTLLTDRPKTFGDIEIWALKSENNKEDEDPYKTLIMKKTEIPFFYAAQNKDGKVTEIAIVGENNSIRLSIKSSEETGGWKTAIYGCTKGYTKGEQYVDIDFDGQFDAKNIFDNQGELLSKWIYSDGIWQKVDYLDDGKAILGQTRYVFDANSGWRED